MRTSWFRSGALAATLLVPSLAAAQGVVIEHDGVACIVAGEYPRLNACFRPANQIARGRVYFRPETIPTWFYVDTGPDAPCHAGILPKPSSKLVGKIVYYYFEAFDRQSDSGRTAEFAPIVVESAEECRKKGIVAPLSATGPAAVFPFMPAGFGGGAAISTGVVLGGVAAAAGITAGAIALGGDDPETQTTTPGGGPTPPPATTPPVTTPPPPPVSRPDALLLACTATPRSGDAPLRVVFTSHPSGGTGVYEYSWSFADGGSSSNPNPSHTYLAPGVYPATVTVTSGAFVAACTRDITVTTPATPVPSPSTSPSTSPSPSPSVSPSPSPSPSTSPSPSPSPSPTTFTLNVNLTGSGTGTVTGLGINCPGDCTETYLAGTVVNLTATPASPPPTVFKQWLGDCTGTSPTCSLTMTANKNVTAQFELIRTLTVNGGQNSDAPGSIVSNPAGITCSWTPTVPCTSSAPFVNGVTVTLTVTLGTGATRAAWAGACAGTMGLVCNVLMDADKTVFVDTFRMFTREPGSVASVSWTTQLDVPGAAGQVAVNGSDLTSVRAGRQEMSAAVAGPVLVEATLARAAGRAGTWRFEFGGRRGFKPGSLRAVVGRVALVTPDSVTFALDGKAGERVVFTFEADR